MTAANMLADFVNSGPSLSVRAQVSAIRSDGLCNIRVSGQLIPGVPCLDSYVDRKKGDWVQAFTDGGTWVVLGRYGQDPDYSTPQIIPQTSNLYSLPSNQLFADAGRFTPHIGSLDASNPRQIAYTFYDGTTNFLIGPAVGKTTIYLTLARSTDLSANNGPVNVNVYPHAYDSLPVSPNPLTIGVGFTPISVGLEVGEVRTIALPADWVAGITAGSPTIRGFVLQPDPADAANSAYTSTYAEFADINCGISLGSWTDYQPVWTTTGTAPSLGTDSTLFGRYNELHEGLVAFEVQFTYGSTATPGTGAFQFSLPVPIRTGNPDQLFLVRILIQGTGAFMGQATVVDQNTCRVQVPTSSANTIIVGMSGTVPAAITTGSTVRVVGTYEPA